MPGPYEKELEAALAAVRLASHICRSVQAAIAPDALAKKDRSPVTVADFASQAAVCGLLAEAFPDDAVVAEEDSSELSRPENARFLEQIAEELDRAGRPADNAEIRRWIDRGNARGGEGRFWTLDPIDGTKGFLRGDQYAVSLALIVDGRIVLAVLGCPNLGEPREREAEGIRKGSGLQVFNFRECSEICRETETAKTEELKTRPRPLDEEDVRRRGFIFYAVRGRGSRRALLAPPGGDAGSRSIGQLVDQSISCRVSVTAEPARARFCESIESAHSSHGLSAKVAESLGITAPPLRMDSQAKYAAVARGEADVYLRLPTRADYVENIWDHAGGALIVEEAGGTVTDATGRPLEWTHGTGLAANRGIAVSNGLLHEAVIEALHKIVAEKNDQ